MSPPWLEVGTEFVTQSLRLFHQLDSSGRLVLARPAEGGSGPRVMDGGRCGEVAHSLEAAWVRFSVRGEASEGVGLRRRAEGDVQVREQFVEPPALTRGHPPIPAPPAGGLETAGTQALPSAAHALFSRTPPVRACVYPPRTLLLKL